MRTISFASTLLMVPPFDEMRPERAGRDLQLQSVERHAIVVADLALLLHAEDLGEIDARDGHEGTARLLRLNREPGVVGWNVDLVQESVGRLHRRDAGQRWLQDRDDSPWYPTMRLHRQPAPGDWAGVAKSVARALDVPVPPASLSTLPETTDADRG